MESSVFPRPAPTTIPAERMPFTSGGSASGRKRAQISLRIRATERLRQHSLATSQPCFACENAISAEMVCALDHQIAEPQRSRLHRKSIRTLRSERIVEPGVRETEASGFCQQQLPIWIIKRFVGQESRPSRNC